MITGLEFIWRKGNPGTKHMVVEVRTMEDEEGKSALRGYLTLTPDELDLLKESFESPLVRFTRRNDGRRPLVDKGAPPKHIRPREAKVPKKKST